MNQAKVQQKSGYGKRPVWQWVLIYVVVGGAVYAAIYYFMGHKSGSGYNVKYTAPAAQSQPSQAPAMQPSQAPAMQSQPSQAPATQNSANSNW